MLRKRNAMIAWIVSMIVGILSGILNLFNFYQEIKIAEVMFITMFGTWIVVNQMDILKKLKRRTK